MVGRSSGSSTRASRAPRSRSSTGPTRSRGCSRTRSCAREIGYQVIGGTKFYERAEIKDAIAYLTVLANPQDVVSFTRVANSPRRGIGQTSLSRVLAHAETMGITVWDAAADAERGARRSAPRRSRPSSASWPRWPSCASAPSSGVPIGDLLDAILHETGYLDALEAERTIEAQGRIENLEELVEVAREFDAAAPRTTRSTSSCSRSRWSPTPTRAATTRAS